MTNEKTKVSLDDVYQLIKEVKGNLCDKIDNINEEIKILTNKVDEELKAVKARIDTVEEENAQLKRKLELVEKKLKKNNLIFYGIDGGDNETQSDLINKVEKIVTDCMKITLNKSDISNCYRIGNGKSRTKLTLVTFISQIKRREILNNGKKLKGTSIYVREDLIEKDLQEQKILVKHLKTARNNNQRAIIKRNKLYIDGQAYSAQDLERFPNHASFTSGYYSPPPARISNSEPPTPTPQLIEEKGPIQEIVITNKEETEKQNGQDENKKPKRKYTTRNPSASQTPKRNQYTRSATLQTSKI